MGEIVTKKHAVENGLRFYFTGKRCKNGHVCNRYTKGGACVDCRSELGKPKKCLDSNGKPRHTQADYLRRLRKETKEYKQDAIDRGYEKYKSPLPCKNGHLSDRYTKSGRCVKCVNDENERIRQDKIAIEMEAIEPLLMEECTYKNPNN